MKKERAIAHGLGILGVTTPSGDQAQAEARSLHQLIPSLAPTAGALQISPGWNESRICRYQGDEAGNKLVQGAGLRRGLVPGWCGNPQDTKTRRDGPLFLHGLR